MMFTIQLYGRHHHSIEFYFHRLHGYQTRQILALINKAPPLLSKMGIHVAPTLP